MTRSYPTFVPRRGVTPARIEPTRRRALAAALSIALLSSAWRASAEESAHRLTLKEAAAHAVDKHPAIASATKKEAAAESKVDVAKSEATPKLSLVGQVNRSTGNVVPGATFAMAGIPGVQGPPGATRFGRGTWQSAAGVTASWDILELVRRPTIVGAADEEVGVAKAQSDVTRLAIVAQTTDAYLVAVEARALVTAAEASLKRTQTFHDIIATLVGQKLRPDIDLARVEPELSAARVLVAKTKLGVLVTSTKLADAIGETGWTVDVVDADFAELPSMPPPASSAPHPAIVAYDDAAKAAEARASVANLGYLPRVEVVGAAWLRGGGYVLGGPNSGDAGGLLPDTPNWGVGLVATWTLTDMGSANAKAKAENAEAAVQKAKAAEVEASLVTEVKIARATLASALVVAKETATAITAARKAVELASTRYTTGNGNVLEVTDAERALSAAERDDAIARLEAWRALAALHRAQGDMQPLVGAAAKAKG